MARSVTSAGRPIATASCPGTRSRSSSAHSSDDLLEPSGVLRVERSDSTDLLHDRRLRLIDAALLERNDIESTAHPIEQLVGPQKIIRIRGLIERLVADHERLIDQHAAGFQ